MNSSATPSSNVEVILGPNTSVRRSSRSRGRGGLSHRASVCIGVLIGWYNRRGVCRAEVQKEEQAEHPTGRGDVPT
jgi:hypothetical protein